jgi:hypothetical protein
MPRLESHASEGMMMAVGMAGSAGERAVVRPLKRFGTRREQKRLRCEAKAAREIVVRQKSSASIQP